MEREAGGGIGMGNTCKPMAVSFQCMTKSTTIKNNNNNKKEKKEKKKETLRTSLGLPRWCSAKESAHQAGDTGDPGSIPGAGRSPGEGSGNPSILAWEMPWTEGSGGLQQAPLSSGLQRARQNSETKQQQQQGLPWWSSG